MAARARKVIRTPWVKLKGQRVWGKLYLCPASLRQLWHIPQQANRARLCATRTATLGAYEMCVGRRWNTFYDWSFWYWRLSLSRVWKDRLTPNTGDWLARAFPRMQDGQNLALWVWLEYEE